MAGQGEATIEVTAVRGAGRHPARKRKGPGRALVLLALYLGAAWSVVAALLTGLVPGAGWLVAALAGYTTLPLLAFLVGRGFRFYPGARFRLLVLRPFWYTQLLLPLVAGAGVAGHLIGLPFGIAPLAARSLAGLVALGVGLLLLAGYLGSRRLVVREVTATLPDLPPAFDGLRVAQLSDLHIGPHIPRAFLARVRRTVESLAPDLIVMTGDLIDDRAEDVSHFAAALGSLTAPLGVFLIPGNHDIYAGWPEVARRLAESLPARVLVNETHLLERGGARLALVGTGDPAAGRDGAGAPDLGRALEAVPAGTVTVALAHNPVLWPGLQALGVSLTLSGHTHWGQFAIPHLGWSLASPFLPHAMGAHHEADALLYISPGTGYWGIPFRIGAPPEVTVVTLRRGAERGIRQGRARAA